MSSTHRGRQRNESDVYQTPAWAVHRLLDAVPVLGLLRWLEPCAGHGAIVRAVNAWRADHGLRRVRWATVELLGAAKADLGACLTPADVLWIEDFFAWDKKRRQGANERYDVCIMNPPFSLAEAFIAHARESAAHVFALERLNFVEGEGRFPLMTSARPDLYILPQRPCFLRADGTPVTDKHGRPATDSIPYAWFHFHAGAAGRWRLLDLTPAQDRRTP